MLVKPRPAPWIFDTDFRIYCNIVGSLRDTSLDESIASRNLSEAISLYLQKAGLSFDNLRLAIFTFAGIDTKKDYDYAIRLLERLGYPRDRVVVEPDAIATLYTIT